MSDGAMLEGWSVGGRQVLPGYHGQRIVKLLDSTECSFSMRVLLLLTQSIMRRFILVIAAVMMNFTAVRTLEDQEAPLFATIF